MRGHVYWERLAGSAVWAVAIFLLLAVLAVGIAAMAWMIPWRFEGAMVPYGRVEVMRSP